MTMTTSEVRRRIGELGPWFHNIELGGVATAPDHFLGDYPRVKWRKFSEALPLDLAGRTVLDIGCNAGFYSIEMKRRGAERVVGIDFDDVVKVLEDEGVDKFEVSWKELLESVTKSLKAAGAGSGSPTDAA